MGVERSGKLGWIAAFIYCACAALRLARFNVTVEVVDKKYFQGLPSPAAAALIAGMIWVVLGFQVDAADITWLAWAMTLFAGLTMVTNIPYYSGKEFNLHKKVSFLWFCCCFCSFRSDSESSTAGVVRGISDLCVIRIWHEDLAAVQEQKT